MSPVNLQYRDSGRGGDIVFFWKILKIFSAVFTMIGALSLFLFWQVPPSFSQSPSVVINEIMPNPSGGPDWIEISNLSGVDMDLSGWYIEDTFSTVSVIKTFEQGTSIRKDDSCFVDVSNRLNNSGDEIRLFDKQGSLVDPMDLDYPISYKDSDKDKSYVRNLGGSFSISENPTKPDLECLPNIEIPLADNPPQQLQPESQEAVTFSAPSTVSVDTPFSVTLTLKNFEAGTYSLKVLIGKGDKFYDGRTKGTDGKWLAWNAGWVDFPKVTAGSSGSGSKTIQAKTDEDVVAGSYLIKVRAYDGKNTFDSDSKSLKVVGLPVSKSSSSGSEEKTQDLGEFTGEVGEITGGDGEVKGEEAPHQDKGFKLNFYTVLGIFGLLVGSGGLILAFRRKAQRLQTPDTLESEPATPS